MSNPMTLYILLALIGAATGALTGLTGASGMSILVSGLLLTGMEIREVIGLTFIVTLANSVMAVPAYWRKNNIDLRTASCLALTAVALIPIGHSLGGLVRSDLLTIVMLVGLFVLGVRITFSEPSKTSRNVRIQETMKASPRILFQVGLGGILGLVMGMMGGGGSVFIATGLVVLFKLPLRIAIGTSVLVMGVAAIPGVILHFDAGTLDWKMAAALLLTSIPSSILASVLANKVSERVIQRTLGIYLLGISSVLAFRLYV